MKSLVFFSICLCMIVSGQQSTSEEGVWKGFTDWVLKQAPNSKPGDLIRSYREGLLRQGIADDEVRRRMGVVSNSIFTRRKGVELLWDKVYAGKNPVFIQGPSAVVMSAIEGRKPGKALDIGMGQGRNSVYLAGQGWDVAGFDPSGEGIRIARSNADKAGVKIRALVARDDEFQYGEDQWDLIVITYVRDLTKEDAAQFWKALRPGGIVVYENGADANNSVLRAFLGYQIIQFEDIQTIPEWNPETNRIRVQRLIAQKTTRPVPCPDPAALDLLKHQLAYQKTEESDPLKGLPLIHADVWMRGPITAFYVHEKLNGFIPSLRIAYLFGEDGLRGSGTCPADQNWKECVEQFAGVEYSNNITQTCTTTVDLRTVPAWKPSPDDPQKRKIADELRREIEAQWKGAEEIVIRDFNLRDPQITIYVKMPDGDYFQGCGFHAMREPHCEGWHLFGQEPISSLRKRIFGKPCRLK